MPASIRTKAPGIRKRNIPTVLGRVQVRVAGTGPAILFWPSLLMDGHLWDAQMAYFRGRHRVVAIDPPGHGASEPLARAFSFDECVTCIVQILDALGIGACHFVGNSWGGMIGGRLAATQPGRVLSAVLMNATASPAPRLQRLRFAALTQAARLLGGLRPPLTGQAIQAFLGRTSVRSRPQVVAAVRSAVEAARFSSVHWAVTSIVPRRPDQRALLATVTCPVLVIAGAEDRTFPVGETREMASAIPGSRFEVLDGVGHLAALEDPDRVNRLIENFVGGA